MEPNDWSKVIVFLIGCLLFIFLLVFLQLTEYNALLKEKGCFMFPEVNLSGVMVNVSNLSHVNLSTQADSVLGNRVASGMWIKRNGSITVFTVTDDSAGNASIVGLKEFDGVVMVTKK